MTAIAHFRERPTMFFESAKMPTNGEFPTSSIVVRRCRAPVSLVTDARLPFHVYAILRITRSLLDRQPPFLLPPHACAPMCCLSAVKRKQNGIFPILQSQPESRKRHRSNRPPT